MKETRHIRNLAVVILMTFCGLLLAGCSSLDTPDVGRLAEDAANDLQREGSDLLSGGNTGQGDTRAVTVSRVVDGDTVEIRPAVDGRTDLRLVGVDAPELSDDEPLAQQAATFTERRLEGERVTLTLARERVDPYGRLLGNVSLQGQQRLHAELMLESGYGQTLFYEPNTANEALFSSIQESARQSQAGIWGLSVEERCELANHGNGLGEGSAEC